MGARTASHTSRGRERHVSVHAARAGRDGECGTDPDVVRPIDVHDRVGLADRGRRGAGGAAGVPVTFHAASWEADVDDGDGLRARARGAATARLELQEAAVMRTRLLCLSALLCLVEANCSDATGPAGM